MQWQENVLEARLSAPLWKVLFPFPLTLNNVDISFQRKLKEI